jgi:hypothetical protein
MDLETEYILAANFSTDKDVLELGKKSWIVLRSSVDYDELIPEPVRIAVSSVRPIDCVIVREYYGEPGIMLEDLLFLFRLFNLGDLIFLNRFVVEYEGGAKQMYPYSPAISYYYPGQTYQLSENGVPEFAAFCRKVTAADGYRAHWMRVARRYFLWGGSKDFNAARDNERIVDYMTALEAVLVSEGDFVSKRLAKRAAVIIASENGENRLDVERRFRKLYGIRSTILHGGTLSKSAIQSLKVNMVCLEADIRTIIRHTLVNCGQDEAARREYLRALSDISDMDRAERVTRDYRLVKEDSARDHVRRQICTEEDSERAA